MPSNPISLPAPDPNVPLRGRIILDASAMMRLAFRIDPKLIDPGAINPPETYLDLIVFLAKNGYQILIPEMVALQATGILHGGTNTCASFSSDNTHPKVARAFIKKIVRETGDINISIIRNTGPGQVDEYCTSLRAIAEANSSDEQKRNRITSLQQTVNKNQFGDDAIRSMLDRLPKEQRDHVFVMGNDRELNDSVVAKGYASISTRSLFHDLAKSKILPHAGLKPETTSEQLFTDSVKNSPQLKPLARIKSDCFPH